MVALVALRLSMGFILLEDDADGIEIVHLLEGNLLLLHLVPHRIGGLDALLDGKVELGFLERFLYGLDKGVHLFLPAMDVLVDAFRNPGIGLRLLVLEPDVLQLRLDTVKAQAVRQRDEDEHGLAQDLVPLVLRHELYGSAVVQPVRQLDEHYPYIVVQGKEDALKVLCLKAFCRYAGLFLVVQDVLDFGKAVHQGGDLVAEELLQVLYRTFRVFHYVVQEGRGNRLVSQADIIDHDLRHGQRMQHIGFSGAPADVPVGLFGKVEGLLHHCQLFLVLAALAGRFHQPGIGLVDAGVILRGKLCHTHFNSFWRHQLSCEPYRITVQPQLSQTRKSGKAAMRP